MSLEQIFRQHVNFDNVRESSVNNAKAAMVRSDSLRHELLHISYRSYVSRRVAAGFDELEFGIQALLAPVNRAFVDVVDLYSKIRAKAFGKAVQRQKLQRKGEIRNSDALRPELKNSSGMAMKRKKGSAKKGSTVETLQLSVDFIQSLGPPASVHAFLRHEMERFIHLEPDQSSQGKGPLDYLKVNVLRGILAMYSVDGIAPAGVADVAGGTRRGGSTGSKADILKRCYYTIGEATSIVDLQPLLRTLK